MGAKEHAKTQPLVVAETQENQTRHKKGKTNTIY